MTISSSLKKRILLSSVLGLSLGLGAYGPASAQDERFPVPVEDTPPAIEGVENTSGPVPVPNDAPVADAAQPAAAPVENTAPQNIMAQDEALPQVMTQDNGADGLPAIDPMNDPDTFYDSMPVRRGAQETTPERMNPEEKPAGKFIIVNKDYDKDDNKSMLVAANRALKLGRYDSALDMYDRLYAKNPRDARVLMGRAIALQNLGRTQLAIKTYEELLEVDPKNVEAEVSMLGLVRSRYPALALKQLATLYDAHPNNAALAAQIGLTYADIGNVDDAQRYLGSAISLDPNNAGYYYNMAIVCDRAKQYKDAISFYEQALNTDSIYGAGRSVPRDVIYERLGALRQR